MLPIAALFLLLDPRTGTVLGLPGLYVAWADGLIFIWALGAILGWRYARGPWARLSDRDTT